MKLLFLIIAFPIACVYAQIDIKHLEGSWFIKEIKPAPNSPTKVEGQDLQLELEGMKEGYIQISKNTIDFINFEGDFDQDVADGLLYTYNGTSKILELKFKDSDESVGVKYKLLELSASHLIYQFIGNDYIGNYHFVRATNEQLIVGSWGVTDVSIAAYIAAQPASERDAAVQLQELLRKEFSFMYLELSLDKTGYLETPEGSDDVSSTLLTWSLLQNILKFTYEDKNTEDIKVISIKHNELILEIPGETSNIVLSFSRDGNI